jgi:hypothetical protein
MLLAVVVLPTDAPLTVSVFGVTNATAAFNTGPV